MSKDRKMYWLRVDVLLFLVARAHRLEKALKLLKLEPFMKFFCMFQQKSHEPVKKPATARCVIKIAYVKPVFTNIIVQIIKHNDYFSV